MPIKILIADDHKLMRNGLRKLLETQKDFRIVSETGDGATTLLDIRRKMPEVVLMDVSMPAMNGIEATREITRLYRGKIKVVAISMYTDPMIVREILKAGASGFLPKSCSFGDLVDAIRHAAASIGREEATAVPGADVVKRRRSETSVATLSGRECEVLKQIAEGRSTRQIAQSLNISIKTAETHRKNIQDKLGIKTVAGLTKYALSHGIAST